MDQTSRLPPTNLKSYRFVSLSKANKSAPNIVFFAHSSIIFWEKKITKLSSAEHRGGLSKSEVRIGSWKWTSQTKAKNQNVFSQNKNTTSKKEVNRP